MSDEGPRFVRPSDGRQPPIGHSVHRPPMTRMQEAILREMLRRQQQENDRTQYTYDRRSEQFDADIRDGIIGNDDPTWQDGAGTNGMLLDAIRQLRRGRAQDA